MRLSVQEALERNIISKKEASEILEKDAQLNSKRSTGKNKGQKRKRDIESEEQIELVRQFRECYPKLGMKLIHIPMGGSRSTRFEGWRIKQQGARKGVSDLFLMVARHGFHGLWIEFKAEPPNTAVVTDEQLEWLEDARSEGYAGCVCIGISQAMSILESYLTNDRKKFLQLMHQTEYYSNK